MKINLDVNKDVEDEFDHESKTPIDNDKNDEDDGDDDDRDEAYVLKLNYLEGIIKDESSNFDEEFLGKHSEDAGSHKIPSEYMEYAKVFSKKLADELPPVHQKYVCSIDFKENYILSKPSKAIPLSRPERIAMEKYIEEGLLKGILKKSSSPIAMSTFMVAKKDGDLRPVVDYRPVNEIVVDNRNPIPRIDELMNYLTDAKIFTKIDSRGAFNLIRIRSGDE